MFGCLYYLLSLAKLVQKVSSASGNAHALRRTSISLAPALQRAGLVEAALPAGASPLRPRRRFRSSAVEAAPLAGAPDGGREGRSPAAGGRTRRGGTSRTRGRGLRTAAGGSTRRPRSLPPRSP
ncbi:hypothetical protein PVAP13_7NG308524 [Panicum virgatum]|uniref:Uncharacterized protein n=1 Tax=Panicum virgatum TaxID=38727 RepID=A0A8T0Q2G8_PANVG|nr:hypothetical protein PVAP13_7NG308524 [Panicum virgatum]